MSEGYQTEEEQVEALKKWWKENGQSTLISVAIAVSGVFGWQAWQNQQQANIANASAAYENLVVAVNTANMPQATPEQKATAKHLAETLKQDFSGSTYAEFAALYKAKLAVDENDLQAAEQELRWVTENSDTVEILDQATLRLARVLYAQEKYSEAMSLASTGIAAYAAAFAELKGDIYWAQNNNTEALLSYQKAQELNLQADPPAMNRLLDLKIEQLNSNVIEPSAGEGPSTAEQEVSEDTSAEDVSADNSADNQGA